MVEKVDVKDLVSIEAEKAVELGELAPDTPLISVPKKKNKKKKRKRRVVPKVKKSKRRKKNE